MDQAQWDATVNAYWAGLVARYIPPAKLRIRSRSAVADPNAGQAEPDDDEPISPLPPKMRSLLLQVLDLGYLAGAPQTLLSNAPDGAVAWQVQSMLDGYAEYAEREAFGVAGI
jgi:hypothetical protein